MSYPIKLPAEVQQVLTQLQTAGFEAYVVGGCLRDVLLEREPNDWDITTNALPEQIQTLFEHTLYLNAFGTVTVRCADMDIEVTTYRSDGQYSDFRHPDTVEFGVSLEHDLARRDFTINALAYNGSGLVDYYNGVSDVEHGMVRAVGQATDRFQEDALRMMRAIRLSAQLGFNIEPNTWQAIGQQAVLIEHVSPERQRDELIKMISSDDPLRAVWLLLDSGLIHYILPELEAGVGVQQNLHHIYTVFFHNLLALQYCPSDNWRVRLAALLHDVGKPFVKQGQGRLSTFYNHEHVGAKLTRTIMKRLAFANDDIATVTHLVKHHMFYYNVGEITDAGVRRLLRRVGLEHINNLMAVRIADRLGSGVQKDKPFKLLELERRIEYVQQDPISTSSLAIDGNDIMRDFGLLPGAKVGVVLHRLLDEVMDDPTRNTMEYLQQRAGQLVADLANVSEAQARNIMRTYRAALADRNAYKG
ncbi:MAG: HD domain-containing protein [Candidatus Kerfeldbacteria bacterium]|nr:HD domain-containing protein [Candidatus Kerfeldbacteria bacterium]